MSSNTLIKNEGDFSPKIFSAVQHNFTNQFAIGTLIASYFICNAGGRHVATAMTVVKPAWEDPVTFAKPIDLSFDLVRCCGEASPTFGLCGKWKSTSPGSGI